MTAQPNQAPRAQRPPAQRTALALLLAIMAMLAIAPGTARAETINWVNVPIGEFVIPRYEAISGKRLLVDNTVAASTLTINTQHDLSNEEAVEFIKSTLLLNGFAIVTKDEKTEVLINAASKSPIGQDAVPRPLNPRVYVNPDDLPAGDRIVTYVMKLDYVAPEDALRLFQVVARPSAFSTIAPVTNVNAIVITDNVPLIRYLVELKEQIDVPSKGVVSEAIQLIRADSTEVAAALNEVLQAQSQSRTGTSGARTNVVISPQGRTAAPAAAGAANAGVVSAPDAQNVTIQAVTRTNSILVIAKPVDIAYIKTLIEIYDAPSTEDNFLKRELKYIPVADFLPVAEQAIARFTDGGSSGGASGRTNSSSPRTTGLNNTANSRNNSRNNNGTSNRNTQGGFSGGGGGGLSADTLGAPEPILIGNTLIIGDPQLNNIVVSGPPEHLRIVDQLLDEIDIRPRQVYINAVIAQVTLGDDIQFGKDLLRRVQTVNLGGETVDIAGVFNTALGTDQVVLDPTALTTIDAFGGAAGAAGLNLWGSVAGGFLDAYVNALENTSRLKVISRPFLYTANNEPASISNGQRIAVPTSTTSSLTNSDTINASVGFEEVLLQLDVVPLINSKDEVTLTVSQTNETLGDTVSIGGNEVSNIFTQNFETRVRLPNKAIVVLGGIISEEERENHNGLPILARIPGIKHLTGSSSKNKSRTELLIFLQPHIIESTEDLVEKNIDEITRTIVGRDAVDMARATPEMDPALFSVGEEEGFLGRERRRGDRTFEEPEAPVYEQAAPSDTPRRGILKKLLEREAPAQPSEKPKRKGLFRRR